MNAREMFLALAEAVEGSEQILEDHDTGQRASIVNCDRLKLALMAMAIELEADPAYEPRGN